MKLTREFYTDEDVLLIARMLLGKVLFTHINGKITAGIISETEAYAGINDKASHAFGDKRTNRTDIMYKEGGIAYVYLCYGIHSLFNVVTNKDNVPHAVLIRSVVAFTGEKTMMKRRKIEVVNSSSFVGPGKVCQALGIDYSLTGTSLSGNKIWIEDKGISVSGHRITTTPRIGVEYAGQDALLPYRFLVSDL